MVRNVLGGRSRVGSGTCTKRLSTKRIKTCGLEDQRARQRHWLIVWPWSIACVDAVAVTPLTRHARHGHGFGAPQDSCMITPRTVGRYRSRKLRDWNEIYVDYSNSEDLITCKKKNCEDIYSRDKPRRGMSTVKAAPLPGTGVDPKLLRPHEITQPFNRGRGQSIGGRGHPATARARYW